MKMNTGHQENIKDLLLAEKTVCAQQSVQLCWSNLSTKFTVTGKKVS